MAESVPSATLLDLLYKYDTLLAQHGIDSFEAKTFFEQNRHKGEFEKMAINVVELRRAARTGPLANAPSKPPSMSTQGVVLQARRRRVLGGVAIGGIAMALVCVAALVGIVLYMQTHRSKLADQQIVLEVKAKKLQKELTTFEEDAKKKKQSFDETRELSQQVDRDNRDTRLQLNELAPALITAINSANDKVRDGALSLIYSQAERLDPIVYKQLGPSLVKILDKQNNSANKATNFARGALSRMIATAVQNHADDTVASLRGNLAKSNSKLAAELLQDLEARRQRVAGKAPTIEKLNVDSSVKFLLNDKCPFDRLKFDSYCRIYEALLKKNGLYQIDLKHISAGLDPYLRIEDNLLHDLAVDDDSGGDFNASLLFRPPHDGVYRIIATTIVPKQSGECVLSIHLREIKSLLDIAQSLNPSSKTSNEDGKPFEAFPIPLQKGREYLIEMNSSQIDSYLRLIGPNGKQVAEDDDGGGNRNARIIYTATTAGDYRIIATCFVAAFGDFQLAVSEFATNTPSKSKAAGIK